MDDFIYFQDINLSLKSRKINY